MFVDWYDDKELENATGQRRIRLVKRLDVLNSLIISSNSPEIGKVEEKMSVEKNNNNDIKSYTYDLSDNIYTRYVSWDPIREGSCDVEIMRLSAIEKQSKRIVEFPINEIISNGEIINNKVEFHNQKGCWIGCKIEGTYESFSIEAKIKII